LRSYSSKENDLVTEYEESIDDSRVTKEDHLEISHEIYIDRYNEKVLLIHVKYHFYC